MLKKAFIILNFFVYLTIYIFISFNSPPSFVNASDSVYLRVLDTDVYVYSDAELTNKIFKLPYGYFVKAENVGSESTRIVYGEDNGDYPVIMGYVKTSKLKSVNVQPTKPFAIIKVSTEVSDILFNDGELKKAYFNVPAETFMYYYGDYINESATLCYVYCKNKLGYIDKSCLNPFYVPDSPDEIVTDTNTENNDDTLAENQPTNDNQSSSNIGENLQIIIIVGISIISISVVYFLFKPSKTKTPEEYATDLEEE